MSGDDALNKMNIKVQVPKPRMVERPAKLAKISSSDSPSSAVARITDKAETESVDSSSITSIRLPPTSAMSASSTSSAMASSSSSGSGHHTMHSPCTYCRLTRAKCDRQRPCARCQQMNQDCHSRPTIRVELAPLPPRIGVQRTPGRSYDRSSGVDQAFVCRANDALHLKLIRRREDIHDRSISFFPKFTHQVFGDEEKIVGYKGLRINLYFHYATLHTYLQVTYEDVLRDPHQVDDVVAMLARYLQPGFDTDLEIFLARLDEPFTPPGLRISQNAKTEQVIACQQLKTTPSTIFEIYQSTFATPGFKDFHERLQFFLLLFIDASSYIDSEDPVWQIMSVFERQQDKDSAGTLRWVDPAGKSVSAPSSAVADGSQLKPKYRYAFVGYVTLYSFLAFPNGRRLRISQILVLPPYQRGGHGGRMIQTVYDWAIRNQYVEVNVEDPSDGFQFLRDLTDLKNCRRYGFFQSDRQYSDGRPVRPPSLVKLDPEYLLMVKRKLLITDEQIVKCYEAFKFATVDKDDEEDYQQYRLETKRRLWKFLKEDLALFDNDPNERKRRLHEIYQEVETKYALLIQKHSAGPKYLPLSMETN